MDYPIPLVLQCKVTGKVVKYYSRPYIEARITKAGDLASLISNFMAKGAKSKKEVKPTRTWKGAEIKTEKEEKQTFQTDRVFEYKDGQCRVVYS
jgi:hypothetical protein